MLPQLDPTIFAPQIIWLLITFGIFYVLMARVGLPKVARVLEDRQNRIDNDLEKAAHLRQQAEDTIAQYDETLAEARNQAQILMNETREIIASETNKQLQLLHTRLNEKLEQAEQKIEQEKHEALKDVAKIATDVASSLSEKLMGEKVSAPKIKAAITAASKKEAA